MRVTRETKLTVNSYMCKHCKTKNKTLVGYFYIKPMLECALEKAISLGYIPPIALTTLMELAETPTKYQNCSKAIKTFIERETPGVTFQEYMIETLEQIIIDNQIDLMPTIDQEEVIEEGDDF